METTDYCIKNGDQMTHCTTRSELPVYRAHPTTIYEDNHLLVVDKPPSIPVHECGAYFHNSLVRYLRHTGSHPLLLRWLRSPSPTRQAHFWRVAPRQDTRQGAEHRPGD